MKKSQHYSHKRTQGHSVGALLMNWGQSIQYIIDGPLRFVGRGNNKDKDKGKSGWLRIEKETIRIIIKIMSHFLGGKGKGKKR